MSAWDLRLGNEPARLISAGWFNTRYQLALGGKVVAEVTRAGSCNGGWIVRHEGALAPTDLLFAGMIFHTILRRNAAASASN